MAKLLFALIGVLLLIICLSLYTHVTNAEKIAAAKDTTKTSHGDVMGPPMCSWKVETPERVISENKTLAILIKVSNPEKQACETQLSLRAPGFDYSPVRDEQQIKLAPNKHGAISWILTPRKPGTFDLAVSDIINTQIFGVNVTNIFGLSSGQAKLFSVVGSIFGPMLTVPWWFEIWRQKRKSQYNQQPQENK